MTANRRISVTNWSESQDPIIPAKQTQRRFWPPAFFGLAGTVLLHTLVLQSALLGYGIRRDSPPEEQTLGSAYNQSKSKPAESLVLLDLPMVSESDQGLSESLASVRAANQTPIKVVSAEIVPPFPIEALPLDQDKDSTASTDGKDDAERARLLGIYSGQIQARVERIWRKPRTPVNEARHLPTSTEEYFHCQVQIVQDLVGNVQEILLPNCNGSAAWQRSLA